MRCWTDGCHWPIAAAARALTQSQLHWHVQFRPHTTPDGQRWVRALVVRGMESTVHYHLIVVLDWLALDLLTKCHGRGLECLRRQVYANMKCWPSWCSSNQRGWAKRRPGLLSESCVPTAGKRDVVRGGTRDVPRNEYFGVARAPLA